MVVRINGKKHWLWRAVDTEGEELDFLVQTRRNAKAARKLMKKLLKKYGFAPSRIVTDKLASYPAAFKAIGLSADPTTRTKTTGLQVARVSTALPLRPRRHSQHLLPPETSHKPV